MSDDDAAPGDKQLTATMGWELSVGPDPEGGYVWILWPRHPDWLPYSARGRAATEEEADDVARTVAQRCVEAVARDTRSADDVRFFMMTVFPDEPAGGAASVPRLSIGQAHGAPGSDEWDALEERSLDWQTRGGRQTFVSPDQYEAESGSRLRELFGCMGALGEQATTACGAARDLDAAVSLPDSPEGELLRRAWAEHVFHWTTAAGHMFLNVVGRTVALDPEVRLALTVGNKPLKTQFQPEDDAHDDWPTLNKGHANAVRHAAAQSVHASVVEAGTLPHRLVTDQRWRAMNDIRNETFHRWRAQTAGVSTMTRRSVRVVGDDGRLPDGTFHDVRGPESSAAAVGAARDALVAFEEVLAVFDRLLPGVLETVTASRIHDDGLLVVHGAPGLFVESARGTGVFVIPVRADKVEEFLAAMTRTA